MAKNKKIRATGGGGTGDVSTAALEQEALLRQEGDSYLQSQINNLPSTSGGGTSSEALEDETNARIAGDLNLQNQTTLNTTKVNQAAIDIEAAFTQLATNSQTLTAQGVIVSETQAAVTLNTQNLAAEIGNRIGADSILQAQIDAISLNFPDTSALTALITAEMNARISADTSLQNQINAQNINILGIQSTSSANSTAIAGQATTIQTHTNQISTLQTSVDAAVTNVAGAVAQISGIQNEIDLNNEAVIELQEAFENLAGATDLVIQCTPDVAANMLVYLDADGVAQPAKSDSIATMPAKFYVTAKPTSTTCAVKKEFVATAPNNAFAGKSFFVSETVAGEIQITVPTTAGAVMQAVGEGLYGNRKFYSISDRLTVRS